MLAVSETLAGMREQYPDVEVDVAIARGQADRLVVDLAKSRRSWSWVATATRCWTTGVGSLATSVVEHAPCAVLVVP